MKSSFFFHARLLPHLLEILLIGLVHFWAGRRINQLCLTPLLSRAVFYEIVPRTSLNQGCDPAAFCLASSGSWTLPSHGHYRQGCSWPLHPWLACSKYEIQKSSVTFYFQFSCVGMLSLMASWMVFHTVLPLQQISGSENLRFLPVIWRTPSVQAVPCVKKIACRQMYTDLCSSCSSRCRQCCEWGTQTCWFPRKCMRFFPICLGDVSAVWGKEENKSNIKRL